MAKHGPAPAPATDDTPAGHDAPKRRLSDKIRDALEHACAQGRDELCDRLRLCYQALLEEEGAYEVERRRQDHTRN